MMVVSNFIVQALRNDALTICGDGSQTRSFCYVDDLVEGFVRLMKAENFTGPVNLGSPDEFTVKALADKVIAAVGSRSRIEQRPLPKDDPTRRKPDISLAKEKLDWVPRVGLDAGVAKTIAYFASVLGASK